MADLSEHFRVPNHADYLRHLGVALSAMTKKRPLLKVATLNLIAGVSHYSTTLPDDIDSVHSIVWSSFEFAAPRLLYQTGFIAVSPTPSPELVYRFPVLTYQYYARHAIAENSTTLRDADVPLLILRAQAEAMRELAMRAHQKPVSLRGGSVGQLSNMQPSALYEMLLAEFERTP